MPNSNTRKILHRILHRRAIAAIGITAKFALSLLALLPSVSTLSTSVSAQTIRRPAPTTEELASLGLQQKTIKVGTAERFFLVQPPTNKSQPAPILLVLHGGGQSMRHLFSANAGATRGWPGLAERENALLLVPNATHPETGSASSDDQTWNDLRQGMARESKADDVAFLLALLDWAKSAHNIDPRRVYVTGASNGGMMTFRLLIEAPERFAAGAAFVSALPADAARLKKPKSPTPLLLANGTLDPLVLWNGGKIAGNRGQTRSIPATVDWWLEANGAARAPTTTQRLPKNATDANCDIEHRVYKAETNGAPVETYTFTGGGHTIPSAKYALPDRWIIRRFLGPVCQNAEGIELAWNFMSKHRR